MNTSMAVHEYGRHSLNRTDSFGPTPLCAISPCFTNVAVAAGTSVTVMGTVLVVVPVGEPMVVGPLTAMQPFGEQRVFVGQHPPPSKPRHSKKVGMHFGVEVQDPAQSKLVLFELQQ